MINAAQIADGDISCPAVLSKEDLIYQKRGKYEKNGSELESSHHHRSLSAVTVDGTAASPFINVKNHVGLVIEVASKEFRDCQGDARARIPYRRRRRQEFAVQDAGVLQGC
jgi:hypothetical protein